MKKRPGRGEPQTEPFRGQVKAVRRDEPRWRLGGPCRADSANYTEKTAALVALLSYLNQSVKQAPQLRLFHGVPAGKVQNGPEKASMTPRRCSLRR